MGVHASVSGELLDVRDLTVEFPREEMPPLRAVDGASLTLGPGQIHGIVGESGAGKSTLGTAVMGLEAPGRITAGSIRFRGKPLLAGGDRRGLVRGRHIGMIFQDPLTSLNPLFTIGAQLAETMRFHMPLNDGQIRLRSIELLAAVGISEPLRRLSQFPHHFSGGMRQRVVIAMALACDPELIIADEPTTALDVSVQAQVLNLIRDLCKRRGTGVLLITHNIGVIAQVSEHMTVMYRGRVVETGPTQRVLSAPEHPYTKGLIAAVPRVGKVLHRFPRIDFLESGGEVTPKRASRPVTPAPASAAG